MGTSTYLPPKTTFVTAWNNADKLYIIAIIEAKEALRKKIEIEPTAAYC